MYGLNSDINDIEDTIPVEQEEKADHNYPNEFHWQIIGNQWTIKKIEPNETQFVESHFGEI